MRSILSTFFRGPVIPLTLLGLSMALAHTAFAAGSSASAITASFTADGMTTGIRPVDQLAGVGSPTYERGANFGPYHTTLILAAGTVPVPELILKAGTVRAHVEGGFGVDTISAEGDAAATGLDLLLGSTSSTSQIAMPPFLHVTAAKLEERAQYEFVAPKLTTVSSNGAISGLVVTGSLVGGKTLKFSGSPTANQVLFQSPTVTITLNHKLVGALISCTPKCSFTPVSIATSALEITLTSALMDGHKVSGQIDIGLGNAGSEKPL